MGWVHRTERVIVESRRGLASALAVLAVTLVGVATNWPASAQIVHWKHNLGSAGTGANLNSGTAEICVFCHTPYGNDSSAVVPLWNQARPVPASFTTYDSLGTSTLEGKVAPVGSVSIACLSCHDGVTSMSAVINAPGSGIVGDGSRQAGTLIGANQIAGKIFAGQITNIGSDLRNDHPIGIQYGGGGITAAAPAAATRDVDFKPPSSQVIGSTRVWWVGTGGTPNANRQKTDMTLYTRAPGSGYTGQTDSEPFVECATCHDPHNSTNSTFLRISNAGSAVCFTCHLK